MSRNRHFQVVGPGGGGFYDADYEGGVSGDVMGYGDEVEGDVMGVGAAARGMAGFNPQMLNMMRMLQAGFPMQQRGGGVMGVQQPFWRRGQLAPGVQTPDEGLVPLPLHGTTGVDQFSLNQQSIVFSGNIQKPFRGERLLIDVVRTGTTATGRLIGQLFVGTDLQQADIDGFDLQQVGSSQAFGVRLTMKAAQPGVAIKIPTRLSSALLTTDTIFVTVTLLGRIIH
jgi:hypothetical protein